MGNSVNDQAAPALPIYEFSLGDELRGERATMGKTLLDVQRDIRIKAAYIAAIEDAEPEVFPNPSFVPGYIRSYARYLKLDPDEIYARFCRESGFVATSAASAPRLRKSERARGAVPLRQSGERTGGFRPDFPMADIRSRGLPSVPISAIGSVMVLFVLILGLGYGGWTVLQNIQRVQFVPIEELPTAVVSLDTLAAPSSGDIEDPGIGELASPVTATSLADLYRQQELEVPILVPRDGPIAQLDPEGIEGVAGYGSARKVEIGASAILPVSMTLNAQIKTEAPDPVVTDPQVTITAMRPGVIVLAERAAWIRVYLENGTVIFEQILESGGTYTVPDEIEAPMVWAGNSGAVFVRVGENLRGPLGSGTSAVRDVVLEPQALTERFAVVEDVPEAISETIGDLTQRADAGLTTQ